MVTPSLADLRRLFFGASNVQSNADAEYAALKALDARDATLLGISNQANKSPFHPPVGQWDDRFSLVRSGGGGALSQALIVVADSRALSSAGHYRKSWPYILLRKLNGRVPHGGGLIQASAGALSGVTDGDWQGGDNPWTYTGSVAGRSDYGIGFHGAEIPSAGTATIHYFGDIIALKYVQTVTGPTACAISLDGVAQTAIDGRNDPAVPGLSANFGTNGQYGHHTLLIDPNDGPFIIEGVEPNDNNLPFFDVGVIKLTLAEHAGFGAKDWAGVNNDWSATLAMGGSFNGIGITVLDTNDFGAGRTPTQFKNDLKTIVSRVDARLTTTIMPWLFVILPNSNVTSAYLAFRDAAWEAAGEIGTSRAAVLDLADYLTGRVFGGSLSGDGSHLTDAGHIWVADKLYEILDPTRSAGPNPSTSKTTEIDAGRATDHRVSWTAALTQFGLGLYDQSGGGTTQGERRHREWIDEGQYICDVTMQEDTGLGTVEVLMGVWTNNTMTLSSFGTKANAAGSPTAVTTRLATTLTTNLSGYAPIYIRKTTASGAVRFIRAKIHKVA